MKKILFAILIAILSVSLFAGMDDYLDAQHMINSAKSYFGGMDRDEITFKYLYVTTGYISNVTGSVDYALSAVNITTYTNYTVTANKVFIPMLMRILKYDLVDDDESTILINTIYRTTSTNTNTVAEITVPAGELMHIINYPIAPGGSIAENREVYIALSQATNFAGAVAVQLIGIEIDE